ncbi:MAG: 30S ribosomal protein S13, partial [Candidatus Nanoarchaeia archaeon]
LSDAELKNVEDAINNPLKYNIPAWMLNRRKDFDDGSDKHLISTDVKLRREFDIKRLKTIRSYRGMRHALGQPVRGQKTRSHFRTGGTVGVKKKPGMKKGKV